LDYGSEFSGPFEGFKKLQNINLGSGLFWYILIMLFEKVNLGINIRDSFIFEK
jgi:hypothetical protein